MANLRKMAVLHSAGATVRHQSPFEKLPLHRNNVELTDEFIKKWVFPFYRAIGRPYDLSWVDTIKQIKDEITPDVTLLLLGDFNWRTRLVGSYFSAVKKYDENIDIIGTHLLRSEFCCVGHIYALTLAFFNTIKCAEFLNKYLDYYLNEPDLYFDQQRVMEAILYLDKVNGTNSSEQHTESWNQFLATRGDKNREINTEYFASQIRILEELGK